MEKHFIKLLRNITGVGHITEAPLQALVEGRTPVEVIQAVEKSLRITSHICTMDIELAFKLSDLDDLLVAIRHYYHLTRQTEVV